MKHPLSTKNYFLIYLVIWTVLIAAHITILHFYLNISWSLALSDALLFEIPIALLGYAFGFGFRYLRIGSGSPNAIISYLALIATGVGIIYFATQQAIIYFQVSNIDYSSFLAESKLWRIAISTFYFAIIVLSYYLIEYSINLEEKTRNQLKLENMLKQTELEALKSQINPHFIFNSLNSISSLTLTSPEKAQDMIIKLSNFLRYCLSNNSNPTNTLKTELDNIKLYMEIEKIRFGDRLVVDYQIESPSDQAQVPSLILQPLFENAIKHGMYDSLDRVEINVSSHLEEEVLILTVSNSFEKEGSIKKGERIGLKNVEERLRLLYENRSSIAVNTDSTIFKVTLAIPQNK